MEYRRKKGRDTWHFCKNCSRYPKTAFETKQIKPSPGELCNECRSKRDNNTCS